MLAKYLYIPNTYLMYILDGDPVHVCIYIYRQGSVDPENQKGGRALSKFEANLTCASLFISIVGVPTKY